MMTFEQARALIEHEALAGVAYTSRYGKYPIPGGIGEIPGALLWLTLK
jgi:hypothetical protein